nr:MAG TPA: hypothetical protein [Caudoviricetes sp.]
MVSSHWFLYYLACVKCCNSATSRASLTRCRS